MGNKVNFDKNLRLKFLQYQAEKDLTQIEMATAFKMKPASYQRFMSGQEVRLTLETYEQIYMRLGVLMFQLVDEYRDNKLNICDKVLNMNPEQVMFMEYMAELVTKVDNVNVWTAVAKALSRAALYDNDNKKRP